MGLEVATYISDLISDWPLGTDKRRFGDDHLRLIKGALQATFPNAGAAITPTPDQFNSLTALSGNISDIITELLLHVEKSGTIKMWDIVNRSIPSGWVLCDGSVITDYGTVPDMRDKFIVGGGNLYTDASSGGSLVTSANGAHTPVVQGHVLTETEMPSHTHSLPGVMTYPSGGTGLRFGPSAPGADYGNNIGNTGGGQSHTHGADAVADHTHTILPKYYAAVFIVKIVDYVDPV